MAKQSITLTNMLTNPSFENTGWSANSACSVAYDSSIKHSGLYSLKVTSTSSGQSLIITSNTYSLIQNHIYYVSVWFYETANNVGSMQCYWPIAEPLMGIATVDSTKLNQWQQLTWRNVRSSWSTGTAQAFRFDFEDMAYGKIAYIDDAMLIDLTAAFGSGNEPSQDWCKENIEYFTGTVTKTFNLPDVYDLTSTTPSKLKTGDILNCPYSGSAKSIILPKGTYKLECWGAQGGHRGTSTYGGLGGYSVGTLTLPDKNTVYIYSGGSGKAGGTSGGFNGGGKRQAYDGGGGASDVRIGSDSLYARVIVAGGGGSCGASTKKGMYGGGTAGGSTTENYGTGGYGGTQTGVSNSSWQTSSQSTSTTTQADAYAGFGFGGNGITYSNGYGGAGGGGWYGGSGSYPDGSGDDDRGGGGGSGYVYTSSTASNYPTGCLLTSDYYLTDVQTVAGNASMPNVSNSTETGHSGDGYVRITVIETNNGNTLIKTPISAPSGYTQLESISFTGTQYIDTGIKAGTNIGFDATFEMLNGQTSSPYYNLFGTHGNDSSGGTSENVNMFRIDTIPVSTGGTEFKWGTTVYDSGITGSQKVNIKLLNKVYTKPDGTTTTLSGTITSNYNIFIGCLNKEGSTYGNFASLKVYNFKIYNGTTLQRNFIPVKRNSDSVLGLYDTINSKFYTNSGTGTFIAGEEANPWKNYKNIFVKTPVVLPNGYTQLEYIKCEGAQYINTGFIPTGNTRLILDFQLDRVAGQALFCGGRTTASGNDSLSYTAFFGTSAGAISRDYYGTSKITTKSWAAGDRIVFDANKNVTTINGDSTLLSNFTLNTSSTSVMPIVLFTTCYQTSSSSSITLSNSNWAYYKVFSCKIYDNGTLVRIVRNFIPAKNSSGTLGLYDTVNSKFYTNAGTGTFTAGEETNPWKQAKGLQIKTDSTTWKQVF